MDLVINELPLKPVSDLSVTDGPRARGHISRLLADSVFTAHVSYISTVISSSIVCVLYLDSGSFCLFHLEDDAQITSVELLLRVLFSHRLLCLGSLQLCIFTSLRNCSQILERHSCCVTEC